MILNGIIPTFTQQTHVSLQHHPMWLAVDAPMYWIWLTKTVPLFIVFLCQHWTLSMVLQVYERFWDDVDAFHRQAETIWLVVSSDTWSLACRLSDTEQRTLKIIKSLKVRLQINTFVSSKIVTCHWTEDKNRLDPNIPKQQSGSRTSHWHAFTKSQNPNKPNESTQGRTEDWPSKSVQDRIW